MNDRASPISRRKALRLFGGSAAATLVVVASRRSGTDAGDFHRIAGEAAAAPAAPQGLTQSCVVRPEQTEGPYFVDELLRRVDIRSDPSTGDVKDGRQLDLEFRVTRVGDNACTPLEGVLVDVWHCDAEGLYSDVQDRSFDTRGQQFLRGYQVTDAEGRAGFTTIYPGWYQGRTVHIHFKIRTDPEAERGYDFTSQLYFDDGLSDRVFAEAPYSAKGDRGTRNINDGIYRQGGAELLLDVVEEGEGYRATIDIGLMNVPAVPTATSAPTEPTPVEPTPTEPNPTAPAPTSPAPEEGSEIYLPRVETRRS